MSNGTSRSTRAKGAFGESLGENFLKEKGYRIIGRNIRSPFGEIDLVAEDHGTLVFIEVKTRWGNAFGWAEESVTRKKRERLIRLASWYVLEKRRAQQNVRFDVLAVDISNRTPEPFRLIQNAFELENGAR